MTPAGPRRPWLAALLEFLLPGLGHLYSGCHRVALFLLLLFPIVGACALVLAVTVPAAPLNLLVAVLLVIIGRLGVTVSAYRAAGRVQHGDSVGRLSRWYSLVAAAVLVMGLVQPLWTAAIRTSLVQKFRIPNAAMHPTVLRGDHLLAAKWAYGWHVPFTESARVSASPPERGDLVVFRFPEDPRVAFIKRVVGLPGEQVAIRDKVVHIDGAPLAESHASFVDSGLDALRDNFSPLDLPEESYFVLGDNRDNSRDSRFWGYLPAALLLGEARVVYWSVDPENESVRWDRLGLILE